MSLNPFAPGIACAASISSYRSFIKCNAHLNNLTSYYRRTNTCRRRFRARVSRKTSSRNLFRLLSLPHSGYRSHREREKERERDTCFDVALHAAYRPLAIPRPLNSPSSHSRRRPSDSDEMRISDNRDPDREKQSGTARLFMRLAVSATSRKRSAAFPTNSHSPRKQR